MDSGTASGLMTGVLIVVFIGIIAWAYSSRRRKDFDEAAQLPLDEDRPTGGKNERNET